MSNSAVFLFGGSLGTLPRDFPPVRRVLCPQLPRKEPPFCPQRLRTQNKVPRGQWRSLEGCMGQALCTPSWAEGQAWGGAVPPGSRAGATQPGLDSPRGSRALSSPPDAPARLSACPTFPCTQALSHWASQHRAVVLREGRRRGREPVRGTQLAREGL